MSASLISCVSWVRQGVAAQHPSKYVLNDSELERVSALAGIELEDARRELERAHNAAKSMGRGAEGDEADDDIDQEVIAGDLSGEDGEHLTPGNGSRRQGRDRERERHRSANNSTASSGTTVAVPGPSNTSRGNLSPVSPMSYNPIVHAVNSEKPRFLLIPSLCANSVCMFPVPA